MMAGFKTAESYRKLIEAERTLTVMLASSAPPEAIDCQERTIQAFKVACHAEGNQQRRGAGGSKRPQYRVTSGRFDGRRSSLPLVHGRPVRSNNRG
jgi:hypothetical protein